jgi:hypothetical protein
MVLLIHGDKAMVDPAASALDNRYLPSIEIVRCGGAE